MKLPLALSLFLVFSAPLSFAKEPAEAFLGYPYKNIQWVSHTPTPVGSEMPTDEADDRVREDTGKVDFLGDGKYETIKVIWGGGVSDHSLEIEIYRNGKVFATLRPKGIQPNFKIEDIDGDGKLEVVLWGAVKDPAMSYDISDESRPFEGHSAPHLFTVSIYKLTDTDYQLAKEYTSKKKYDPFCKDQPEASDPVRLADDKPKAWVDYDTNEIVATDPSQITEAQFYDYKQAIIGGFSGSGGFFLGKAEIEWIKKAVAALEAKGIKLKEQYPGETELGYVYADSYFHLNEYKKAIEEYRKIGDSGRVEEVEWYSNNEGINISPEKWTQQSFEGGVAKVVEYPGKIPYDQWAQFEEARAEDAKYLFVSIWKGPIYRYDKANDKHAVIYCSFTKYDRRDSLKWDGKRLLIGLSDNAGQFEFDNSTNSLRKIPNVEKVYKHGDVDEVLRPQG